MRRMIAAKSNSRLRSPLLSASSIAVPRSSGTTTCGRTATTRTTAVPMNSRLRRNPYAVIRRRVFIGSSIQSYNSFAQEVTSNLFP